MAFDTLTPTGKTMREVLEEVDNRLPLTGQGSPVGTVVGRFVGQRYIDTDASVVYIVVSTDGTAAGTAWADVEMESVMLAAAHGSA